MTVDSKSVWLLIAFMVVVIVGLVAWNESMPELPATRVYTCEEN